MNDVTSKIMNFILLSMLVNFASTNFNERNNLLIEIPVINKY